MSDTQFSAKSPVYPQVESRQGSTSSDEPEAEANVLSTSETPNHIEIDGKSYTEEQLKTYIGSSMMKADYTRKTQDLARQREELANQYQSKLDELESLKADLLTQKSGNHTPEGDDEISRIMREIHAVASEVKDVKREFQKDREQSAKDLATIRADTELEEALDSFEGKPFFNRDDMKHAMTTNGLKAYQAQLAYNYLYGARIGQEYGRLQAIKQGASARPPMGGSGSSISPGFATMDQLANSESLYQANGRMKGMKDITKMALTDQEIP